MRQPQKLKYLLCPLVAQSELEQQRFYVLFDQFLAEVMPISPPPPPKKKWWKRVPWWAWLGLGIGLITLLVLLFWVEPITGKFTQIHFEPSVSVRQLGETLTFEDRSQNVNTARYIHRLWQMTDDETGKIERADSVSRDWRFVLDSIGGSPVKKVRLCYLDSLKKDTIEGLGSFIIVCKESPRIDTLLAPQAAKVDEEVTLTPRIRQGKKPISITWVFGDGDTLRDAKNEAVHHTWQRNGIYKVELTASYPEDEGICNSTYGRHHITIGSNKASLPLKPLWKDTSRPFASFAIGTWLLLSLLGMGMIWHWVKWLSRKAPADPGTTSSIPHSSSLIPDKGPYFIPFQPKDGVIRVEREMYRIADLLRRRQKGLRQEMDVAASIRATTEGGGFPRLLTTAVSVPAEYLFLLDEQSVNSHQARLFERLVNFLKQRDIYAELFRFKTDFQRFWNPQFPQGIGTGQLRRMFPTHRLIILGDAHALVAPQSSGKARLRTDVEDMLPTWKRRLLLTPQPPVAWTYREALLHEWFGVFPADLEGLSDAMEHFDIAHEDDHPVAFKDWQIRHTEGRSAEATTNYRRWRTAADHEAYLKNHPELFTWLCAIALWPKPVWPLTLAIGQVLEPLGVRVTHDNLLILSRIPWLQTGDLDPELRLELLARLSPDAEKLAREAIRRELEAAQPAAAGGHANNELQAGLALQNVALHPDDPAHRQTLKDLLAAGILTEEQLEELDGSLRRQSVLGEEEGVQEFLNKKEAPPKPPFFTKNFIWACWLTAIFATIFILVLLFDGKNELYRFAFSEEPAMTTECEGRHYFFVKENCFSDSAIWYNNRGVDAYRAEFGLGEYTKQAVVFNESVQSSIFVNFSRAATLRPDYLLPVANEGKTWYNAAAERYNQFLFESKDTNLLQQSLDWFRQAARYDSVSLDALHGLGLAHFAGWEAFPKYQAPIRPSGKLLNATPRTRVPPDSALYYYRMLLDRTDSLFFDTTSVFPNLKTLLFPSIASREPVKDTVQQKTKDKYLWCLSNGHGKLQPGKRSPVFEWNGQDVRFFEYEFNRDIVERITKALDTFNIPYFDVVPDYQEVGSFLTERVNRVNNKKTTLKKVLISVDANAESASENAWVQDNIRGIETWYQEGNKQSKQFAGIFQKYLISFTGFNNRSIKSTKDKPLYVLEETESIAILTENGIYNNRYEVQELMKDEVRQKIADAHVAAILEIEGRAPEIAAIIRDTDKDGIPNRRDRCPTIKGVATNSGCPAPQVPPPADTDADGVPDKSDNCPTVYNPGQEDANLDGIGDDCEPVVDTDGDGVQDSNDKCPKEKGDPNNGGCPLPQVELFKEPEMVFVPGGTFMMGCDEKRDGKCEDNELPLHEVRLDDFYIGKYEVTQAQWQAVMGYNPSYFKNCDQCPVEDVYWNSVTEFIQKLNEKTGKKYRLPTEAEWEYAARGGEQLKGKGEYPYSGSYDLSEVAWHSKNSNGKTHPVGGKRPNQLGVFDMSGNVREWCSDWYEEFYYKQFSKRIADNPIGPSNSLQGRKVNRGGGSFDIENSCRIVYRDWANSTRPDNRIGFRLVLDYTID